MRKSTILCLLLSLFLLYSCTNNSTRNSTPKTDDEKLSNLLIDAGTYANYTLTHDSHGIISMTKPEFVKCAGGKTQMLNALEAYEKQLDEGGENIKSVNISVTSSEYLQNDFLVGDGKLFKQVILKIVMGTKNEHITTSTDRTLIAESIDGGVYWNFVDVSHLKHFGVENIYTESDCKILDVVLNQTISQ